MPSKVVRVAAAQLAMKRPLRMTVNRYKKTPQLDKLTTELQKVDDLEWLRLIESELEQIQQNKEE